MHEGKALISQSCEGWMGLQPPRTLQAEALLSCHHPARSVLELSPLCPRSSPKPASPQPRACFCPGISARRWVRSAARLEIIFQRMDVVEADDKSWFPRLALSPVTKGIILGRARGSAGRSPPGLGLLISNPSEALLRSSRRKFVMRGSRSVTNQARASPVSPGAGRAAPRQRCPRGAIPRD